MKEQLEALRSSALAELATLDEPRALEEFRVRLLGKKGEVTALLRGMGAVPAEERPAMGQLINGLRTELEEALAAREAEVSLRLKNARLAEETVDVTLPGKAAARVVCIR